LAWEHHRAEEEEADQAVDIKGVWILVVEDIRCTQEDMETGKGQLGMAVVVVGQLSMAAAVVGLVVGDEDRMGRLDIGGRAGMGEDMDGEFEGSLVCS
jgi:hypothetical protein